MMQVGTMIRSTTTYTETLAPWKHIEVRKGDVGVIVRCRMRGRQKKYLVRFLLHPGDMLWALPGTIRRLE